MAAESEDHAFLTPGSKFLTAVLNQYQGWEARESNILQGSAVFSGLLQGSKKSVVPRAALASPVASPGFYNLGL